MFFWFYRDSQRRDPVKSQKKLSFKNKNDRTDQDMRSCSWTNYVFNLELIFGL